MLLDYYENNLYFISSIYHYNSYISCDSEGLISLLIRIQNMFQSLFLFDVHIMKTTLEAVCA